MMYNKVLEETDASFFTADESQRERGFTRVCDCDCGRKSNFLSGNICNRKIDSSIRRSLK
jgi:hypothetical protein